MATEHKTHWRKIAGKEFLIGEMLDGKEVTLTIDHATQEEVQSQKGKEKKAVIYFKGTTQKMVANVTNMKAIAKELGSPYVEDWAGKQITLIPVSGRFFGEEQEVIRIKQNFKSIKV